MAKTTIPTAATTKAPSSTDCHTVSAASSMPTETITRAKCGSAGAMGKGATVLARSPSTDYSETTSCMERGRSAEMTTISRDSTNTAVRSTDC
jgi:hypothetical protein